MVAINAVGEFVAGQSGCPNAECGCAPAHDLPPDPEMAMLSRYLRLCPFPPGLQDPALPVPLTTHYLRPMLGDRSGPEELPPWVGDGAQTASSTSGWVPALNKPEVFRAVIAGLRDEALTLIVTVGRDRTRPTTDHSRPTSTSSATSHSRCCWPTATWSVNNGGSGTLVAAA